MEEAFAFDQFSSTRVMECKRPSAGYHPSVWEEHFLPYASQSMAEFEESALQQNIQEFKNEVKKIMVEATSNDKSMELLFSIDDIQHLGIAYHFEKEIDEALKCVYQRNCDSSDAAANDDLHSTAIMFMLLRKKGYNIPCTIFEKFKTPDGKVEESIKTDTRALLSLYEATYLRGKSDYILEEALPLTLTRIASVKEDQLAPRLNYEISRALKGYGTRIRFERLEASHFIKIYQEEPSHNEVLLRLAKLDFNMLQRQHQRELSEMTRWWRSLEVKKNFPFTRDRLAEAYFWGLLAYQPERVAFRIICTKAIAMITIVDDIFDIHGTPEELDILADAVERWEMEAIDELPANYMKKYYKALLDAYSEIDQLLPEEARSYGTYYGKESMKDIVRSYHVEAKWRHQKYFPTLEEYMEGAGFISSGAIFIYATGFLGMTDVATKDVFEWLFSTPKIIRAGQIVIRLLNDIVGYEMKVEEELGQVKAVECYMKQHGVTDTVAKKELWKLIDEAWKDFNDEFLALMNMNVIPAPLLTMVVDMTLMMLLWHEGVDIYSISTTKMKDAITAVLVESFPIDA